MEKSQKEKPQKNTAHKVKELKNKIKRFKRKIKRLFFY